MARSYIRIKPTKLDTLYCEQTKDRREMITIRDPDDFMIEMTVDFEYEMSMEPIRDIGNNGWANEGMRIIFHRKTMKEIKDGNS